MSYILTKRRRELGIYTKSFIIGLFLSVICFAVMFLFNAGRHDFLVFLAQSLVDNAIFCGMFIIVVLVTGINC